MNELPEPGAFVKSSEWNDAKAKRMSFNGWRHDYGDCDMRLYTEDQLMQFAKDEVKAICDDVLSQVSLYLQQIVATKQLARDMDQPWSAAAQGMHRIAKNALSAIPNVESAKSTTSSLEEHLEESYWRFDAKRKGYAMWHDPMSERDAYKSELRKLLKELK